jgi:hypothetical protein
VNSDAQHLLTCWRTAADDVEIGVLLAGERSRRQILRGRAGADRIGRVLVELGECSGDCCRQIVGDSDRFEDRASLCAERANRLPVVRLQVRQPIKLIVDRWRLRDDPAEGVRGDAEARRHADVFDPQEFAKVRALTANDCDLRLIDLLKTQHVAAHRSVS